MVTAGPGFLAGPRCDKLAHYADGPRGSIPTLPEFRSSCTIRRYRYSPQGCRNGFAEFEQLRSAHPEQVRGVEPVAAEARLNLAAVFVATNRPARADEPLQRGLKVYERLVVNYALMPS